MEHHANTESNPAPTIFSWLELATGFWEEVSKIINDSGSSHDHKEPVPSEENLLKEKHRTYETWKTGLKHLNSFVQMMTTQENREAISDSMVTMFEFLTQITGDSSENILDFQSQLLQSISRIGEHTKAYNFDDIDQRIFESSRKLYDKEFRQYYYLPKLGLTRYHLERISILIDKFNVHYAYLSEMIYLCFVPLEKTNRIMQAKIDEMLKHNETIEKPDAVYNEWIKMLEGHYMKLLQSEEYTETMKSTIDSLAEYRKAKDDVLCMMLKNLPIPTNKEMDDVYQELYTVKKQLKELMTRMDQIENRQSGQPSA